MIIRWGDILHAAGNAMFWWKGKIRVSPILYAGLRPLTSFTPPTLLLLVLSHIFHTSAFHTCCQSQSS